MSQEIDDLLEIDSNSEQTLIAVQNLSKHIIIRTIIPFLIGAIGSFLAITNDSGGYNGLGILLVTGGIMLLYLVIILIEMLIYFGNKQKQKANANLKVFGFLLILSLIIAVLFLGLEF